MAPPVLVYDLGSPYAYLAVERAEGVLGVAPSLQPILLGAIFAQRGSGSWARTSERAAGMAEVERRARAYGLPPVAWPPDWPSNTLQVMRAATWAQEQDAGPAFADAAFRAAFAEGQDLGDLDVIADAAGRAGLSDHDVRAAAADPAIKDRLRAATAAAWDRGVRGVPTLLVGDHAFYGDDQLEKAAATI